jgi:hypothetical protein
MTSLDAVYKILHEAGEPLHVEEITRRMLAQGLWTTTGKTPEYTINTNILNDIKKHSATSRFRHLGHRTYALQNGKAPQTVVSPKRQASVPIMPAKRESKEAEPGRIESKEIKNRVRQILTDLERVREALLALSDDIWLNINHNDPEALDDGVAFKRSYNEKMGAFNQQASELSSLIQQFTRVPVETPVSAQGGRNGAAENERIIRELDRDTPHYLGEHFSYKRPYGFVLRGQAYKDIVTWQRVYTLVCTVLSRLDPMRFAALPDNDAFITRRGNKDFARHPNELRIPLEIIDGVYAETNLSANDIAKRISRLLDTFGIDQRDFVIYLRQDRDAEENV